MKDSLYKLLTFGWTISLTPLLHPLEFKVWALPLALPNFKLFFLSSFGSSSTVWMKKRVSGKTLPHFVFHFLASPSFALHFSFFDVPRNSHIYAAKHWRSRYCCMRWANDYNKRWQENSLPLDVFARALHNEVGCHERWLTLRLHAHGKYGKREILNPYSIIIIIKIITIKILIIVMVYS